MILHTLLHIFLLSVAVWCQQATTNITLPLTAESLDVVSTNQPRPPTNCRMGPKVPLKTCGLPDYLANWQVWW